MALHVHDASPLIAAGSIDSGAALLIAEVLLQAMVEMPGGRELLAAALERKIAGASLPGTSGDTRASLMIMRHIVEGATEPDLRTAA